jgi:hypothetical protein
MWCEAMREELDALEKKIIHENLCNYHKGRNSQGVSECINLNIIVMEPWKDTKQD